MVVAESRGLAEDAASLVELDLEPLPAVLDARAGLAPDAPKARLDCPDNLVAHWVVSYGDVEGAFAGARTADSRSASACTRAAAIPWSRAASWRASTRAENLLTVWDSTQMPHRAKRVLVEALGLAGASGPGHRARRGRRLRTQEPVLSGGAGGAGGGASAPTADQMDRGPARELHRHQSRAHAGLGHGGGGRSATAGSAPSAAIFVTTTALRHLPGFRCRRTRSPISSAPMCCRRCGSRSPAASPTWWRRPRPAAPAARKAPS